MYQDILEQGEKEDKRILSECEKEMSDQDYELMMFNIEESGFTYGYEFCKEPIGQFQKEDNYWVNQTTNGGYLGDEFRGTLCFKVSDKKYLKINYSM